MKKIFKVMLLSTAVLASLSSAVLSTANFPTIGTNFVYADDTIVIRGFDYDSSTLPTELTVGETGQIKRPANSFLRKTNYSFKLTSSNPAVLSFNEKGEWTAHKAGQTQVTIDIVYPEQSAKLKAEFDTLNLNQVKYRVAEIAMAHPITITVGQVTHDVESYDAMNRLYNPNSGEHFYTAASAERDYLVKLGWHYEGTGWNAPQKGQAVYRLYNPNAGDHHYTTSTHERDYLVKVGWRYEGEGWKSGGIVPVYRLYNPNAKKAGAHHYTISSHERDHLVRLGWRDEGIGWYAVHH